MKTVEVRLRIRKTTGWQAYTVQVPPEAYVLDAIEAAGTQDTSLLFRHSCHHASCGSCGVRINGREKLACITTVGQVSEGKRAIQIEPLRNFPIIGDLLVDMGAFLRKLACITTVAQVSEGKRAIQMEPLRNFPIIGDLLVDMGAFLRKLDTVGMPVRREAEQPAFHRFENCIECGLCVSACPIAGRDEQYAGPALLAAAGRVVAKPRGRDVAAVLRQVDEGHGAWRCHAAFECSEVCPANVDPAREIMGLRSRLLRSGMQREA